MKSIQRRFNNFKNKNQFLSSYMNFAKALENSGFSKDTIGRWFNILVDESDYDKKDKKLILKHLEKLSKAHEDNGKHG